MECPSCSVDFHDQWDENSFKRYGELIVSKGGQYFWVYRTAICSACKGPVIEIALEGIGRERENTPWRMIYPSGTSRGPVPKEVPRGIAEDYVEACNVLAISPKASAALARRCLQSILRAQGYKSKDLAKEVDLLLAEADPKKALPLQLREVVDGIRNFGNFSAHPIDDMTSLQVIDVEPHEADWCLEILEDLFEHFYVGPAVAKSRKAALDAKLKAAGKPPSK